jgi:hypothetical protein
MKSTHRIISRNQARKLAICIVEDMDFCEILKILNYNTEVFFEECGDMKVKIHNRFDTNEDTKSEVERLANVARNL